MFPLVILATWISEASIVSTWKAISVRNPQYYIYLEPVCPLFWSFNPPKQGLFQSKQWSFGFQVYICNYILGVAPSE